MEGPKFCAPFLVLIRQPGLFQRILGNNRDRVQTRVDRIKTRQMGSYDLLYRDSTGPDGLDQLGG